MRPAAAHGRRPSQADAHSDGRRPTPSAVAPAASWAEVVRAPRVGPPVLSQQDIDAGWQVVKRKSNGGQPSGRSTTAFTLPERARPILRWLQGRCFCCLGLGHLKADCKGAPRCYRCWFSGHLERDCKFDRGPSSRPRREAAAAVAAAVPPAPAPTREIRAREGVGQAEGKEKEKEKGKGKVSAPSSAQPPRCAISSSLDSRMENLGAGDPFLRPAASHGVLSWTPGMAEVERRLLGRALVASVLSGRKEVSPARLVEELGRACGILHSNVRVEVTRPSDFLIYFARGEDCTTVLNQSGRLTVAGAKISFRRWHRSVHARSSKMAHVVRLAIEGLPAHAVEVDAIKQFLNKIDCQFIEWFEPVDACMTEVLAWSSNPSLIPKEFALEIPEPMMEWWGEPEVDDVDMFEALVAEAPPAPPSEKRCLTFDLLLHLLEVVDPMQATEGESSDDVFGPPRRRTHRTYLGRIDGTGPGPILGGGHRFAGPGTWAAGGMQFQRQLQRGPCAPCNLRLLLAVEESPRDVLESPARRGAAVGKESLLPSSPVAVVSQCEDSAPETQSTLVVVGAFTRPVSGRRSQCLCQRQRTRLRSQRRRRNPLSRCCRQQWGPNMSRRWYSYLHRRWWRPLRRAPRRCSLWRWAPTC